MKFTLLPNGIETTAFMNKLFTILFLFLTATLFAQPANDECETLIDLGVLPFCAVDTFFSSVDATQSNIGNDNVPMNCNPGGDWNFTGRDVWFKFVASDTIEDYSVTITGIMDSLGGSPLTNPQVAIYRGECGFDELALLSCARAELNGTTQLNFELLGLDFGETYFLRINDWSSTATPNSGSFLLCLKERDPISTIDQDGSTACSGNLFDDGGPNEDYSPNSNNSFSICPNAPFNSCVTFNLQYFNLESGFGGGDNLVFYDGPDNNSPVIDELIGGNFDNSEGGVCYTVQASSGCLTVELISDGTTEFEGFAGSWECSGSPCENPSPITIETDVNEALIVDALTTSQTVITVENIDCPDGALGTFIAGDDTDLGLDQGIILTSGEAINAIGPNDLGGASTLHDAPGDSDLDYFSSLNGGDLSEDACVVELDVFVATDELRFEYIFGSEEYPEFVDDFNDIFALLVKGPGIVGDPMIDNQQNVAIIPGTNTFVEINSVNAEDNWEYYRNNINGPSVQYDGLTSDFQGIKKSLTASVPVIPCNNYKLKFAIADRGDDNFDSGVFIGELRGGVPNLSFGSAFDIDFLVEDCSGTEDLVFIRLNNPLEDPQNYNVTISGTATRDVDYILDMPDQITIPSGETELSFSIIPLTDLIAEGDETIIISLTNDFGCGVVDLENIEITILDQPLVEINLGADTALVCLADSSSSVTLTATGASEFIWTPSNIFDDNNEQTVVATPTEDGYVFVTGQLGALSSCVAEDSIFLQLIDPQITIETDGPTGICRGDTVQLTAVNNVDGLGISWTPSDDLSNPNEVVTDAFPNFNETYVATINITGCVVTDTVTIEVNAFDFPEVIPDTTICQGTPIELASQIFFTTTEYSWAPAETIEDPAVSNATATPQETTTYVLTATSDSDFCSRMDSVEVTVIEAAIDITNDTTFVCLGESVQLETNIVPLNNPIVWSPDDGGINDINSPNPIVTPTTSTTYFATLQTPACLVIDSVFIQVDSLPLIDTIMLDPFKEVYCPGDTVILSSELFDPMDYPDLENLWFPLQGQVTPDSLFNLVVITIPDTTIYTRLTTNNACSSTVSVEVPVVDPEISITPDTTVCTNDPFQLFVETSDPDATYEWSPTAGLSCTDCPDPIVTVTDNILYTVEADVFGCPVEIMYQSDIIQLPTLNLIPDQALCIEDSISLGSTAAQANTTYTWTSTDPNFSSTDINPVVMPDQNASYTVVADNEICPSVSETVNLEVVEMPTLTVAADQVICLLESVTLGTTVDQPGVNFTWTSTDPSFSSTDPNPVVTPSQTTTYTVVADNGACPPITASVTIEVIQIPVLNLMPDQAICFQQSITLSTTVAQPGVSFTWTSSDPTFNSTDLNPVVTPNQTASYTIVADNGLCPPVTETINVEVIQPITFTVSEDNEICRGDDFTLTATPNPTSTVDEFNWVLPNGESLTTSSIDDTASDLGEQFYTVNFTNGCEQLSEEIRIIVHDQIRVDSFTFDPFQSQADDCPFDEGQIIAITAAVDSIQAGTNYQWSINDQALATNSRVLETQLLEDGSVTFDLQITTENGCITNEGGEFCVNPAEALMPNAFTPNADINNFFNVVTKGLFEEVENFRIWNRFGDLVYDNNNPTMGWDGRIDGKLAPSDVYLYFLSIRKFTGEVEEFRGDVTLIR